MDGGLGSVYARSKLTKPSISRLLWQRCIETFCQIDEWVLSPWNVPTVTDPAGNSGLFAHAAANS